jgi:Pseudouridylate synthases, 23S RNA-specific
MKILHIDNHLLAVDKPAGMPSQPDSSEDVSLADAAKAWLRNEFKKPGNVYLGLVHRLDRPTSGVVLLARTDKAASRLSEQFRARTVEKTYVAVVVCHKEPAREKTLESYLHKQDNGNMAIVPEKTADARLARLRYSMLARAGRHALVRVALETGVRHQIRAQLAADGLPVLGDFRYGPCGKPARPVPVLDGHAILLHAVRLGCVHPVKREPVVFTAPFPDHWNAWLEAFPGNELDSAGLFS